MSETRTNQPEKLKDQQVPWADRWRRHRCSWDLCLELRHFWLRGSEYVSNKLRSQKTRYGEEIYLIPSSLTIELDLIRSYRWTNSRFGILDETEHKETRKNFTVTSNGLKYQFDERSQSPDWFCWHHLTSPPLDLFAQRSGAEPHPEQPLKKFATSTSTSWQHSSNTTTQWLSR